MRSLIDIRPGLKIFQASEFCIELQISQENLDGQRPRCDRCWPQFVVLINFSRLVFGAEPGFRGALGLSGADMRILQVLKDKGL
jgi:hypothetical protein